MLTAVLAARSKLYTPCFQGIYCAESRSISRKFKYYMLKTTIKIIIKKNALFAPKKDS